MPTIKPPRRLLALLLTASVAAASCGDDDVAESTTTTTEARSLPQVVVTTDILGDVVDRVAGEQVDVVVVLPRGTSPHDFQPSAQQVDQIDTADVLVVNGGGFEEGLLDPIRAATADGVPTFDALAAVTAPLALSAAAQDEDDDEQVGADEGGTDEGGTDEGGGEDGEPTADDGQAEVPLDPHFFTDPVRMIDVVDALADFLAAELPDIDGPALEATALRYIDELTALDESVAEVLAVIPEDRRVLVTNHDVFAYFADRYGFTVAGIVIPGGGTGDSVSPRDLADLADQLRRRNIRAIFADTSSSDDVIRTVADEVGDIEIVTLFTETLGFDGSGAETYLALVRTNARLVADALGGE